MKSYAERIRDAENATLSAHVRACEDFAEAHRIDEELQSGLHHSPVPDSWDCSYNLFRYTQQTEEPIYYGLLLNEFSKQGPSNDVNLYIFSASEKQIQEKIRMIKAIEQGCCFIQSVAPVSNEETKNVIFNLYIYTRPSQSSNRDLWIDAWINHIRTNEKYAHGLIHRLQQRREK
jgi:hypothetical protein